MLRIGSCKKWLRANVLPNVLNGQSVSTMGHERLFERALVNRALPAVKARPLEISNYIR